MRVKRNDDVNGAWWGGAEYMIHWAISWSWVSFWTFSSVTSIQPYRYSQSAYSRVCPSTSLISIFLALLPQTCHLQFKTKTKWTWTWCLGCLTFPWSPTLSWQNKALSLLLEPAKGTLSHRVGHTSGHQGYINFWVCGSSTSPISSIP